MCKPGVCTCVFKHTNSIGIFEYHNIFILPAGRRVLVYDSKSRPWHPYRHPLEFVENHEVLQESETSDLPRIQGTPRHPSPSGEHIHYVNLLHTACPIPLTVRVESPHWLPWNHLSLYETPRLPPEIAQQYGGNKKVLGSRSAFLTLNK